MREYIAGVENAGVEIAGVHSRGGKCRSGNCGSRQSMESRKNKILSRISKLRRRRPSVYCKCKLPLEACSWPVFHG